MQRIYLLIILPLVVSLYGCDSYLDRQPDEPMTTENIFKKRATTLQYLVNVYSWIPNEAQFNGQRLHSQSSSDETSCVYTGRFFGKYNRNTVTAANADESFRVYTYDNLYIGIREATYFMQHVGECPELTEKDAAEWHAEARFLRAYYYYQLMRFYGPVFLLYDELADINSNKLSDIDRAPWDECVNWVVNELDVAARDLPLEQGDYWRGRATKGAAMAVKARLLLYSARPLFNGNELYKNIVRQDGVHLFSLEKDAKKWELAAQASKDIINLGRYSLVNKPGVDAFTNIHNVFIVRGNEELIFTIERNAYDMRVHATPANIGGTSYGGVAPTQKLVDAFAMSSGRYPIKGYTNNGATPIIDEGAGYSEVGFSNYTHPMFNTELNTFKMYQNREPRFYANIFWSGLTWIGGSFTKKDIQLYTNGNSGPKTSNNYPPTGYLAMKYIDTSINTTNGEWGNMSYPLFRYAEVLLNYIEALNEYDPTHPNILTYWNELRQRAGVPDIESIYPDIVGNQELQRYYIRKERQVELCFENQRYFDTRTWMTSEIDDNGPVYGMNVGHVNHTANGDFWKRTQVQTEGGYVGIRIFDKKKYLLPIHQGEGDRVKFTQNYGW